MDSIVKWTIDRRLQLQLQLQLPASEIDSLVILDSVDSVADTQLASMEWTASRNADAGGDSSETASTVLVRSSYL